MLDPTTFEYADSVWQDIFNTLKNAEFDVYSPSAKVGECTRPYVVVTVGTSAVHQTFSTNVDQYSVMCYVPKMQYSKLEPYVRSVMAAMRCLEPYVVPYGSRTPSFYDDGIKAHMVSIEYKNHKKIR